MNVAVLAQRARRWRLRQTVGFVVLVVGAGLLLARLPAWLAADPRAQAALAGGLVAAFATAIGTLPVLAFRRVSAGASDAMLGFGAGVMLAAVTFSLVLPAIEAAMGQGHGGAAAGTVVGAGLLLGALAMAVGERLLARELPSAGDVALSPAQWRAWLFSGAIVLHNVPEGLAIGAGYAGPADGRGDLLATGIALQDLPEGLVIALVLRAAGVGRLAAVGAGAASGLVEPLAALVGIAALTTVTAALPWGLALAAGAMLYAIAHEAIPGSQSHGHGRAATLALVAGFALMTLLDAKLSAG